MGRWHGQLLQAYFVGATVGRDGGRSTPLCGIQIHPHAAWIAANGSSYSPASGRTELTPRILSLPKGGTFSLADRTAVLM